MTEEKILQDIIDEGSSDLAPDTDERASSNKDEQHVVTFSAIRTVRHHMKEYPAFRVKNPKAASGIQWFWDKRGGFIQQTMMRCYDRKKQCKIWVYYRYSVQDLDNQILGEAYRAEEHVDS